MDREIAAFVGAAGKPLRIAVTGGIHVGKTTRLMGIYEALVRAGMRAGGFIEAAVFEGGKRAGYDFIDLNDGDRCIAARTGGRDGKYVFYEEGWKWVEYHLERSEAYPILIIDELGRLEVRGAGMMPYFMKTLERVPRHVIASVRGDALERIEAQAGAFDRIIRIEGMSESAF